ncbi:MAG: tRNA (5-methylaminomethyl-2-thiouridine)(34)-methyltransferase MnmD [Henriciella sp.]|nr:tRNA (5-methylaminomethyl-2-thiouridine)(34)-methyltransferase MnmD [Henriciella sp.]
MSDPEKFGLWITPIRLQPVTVSRYVAGMRLPPRPKLDWKPDGTPVDTRFGDIYYSVEDGLAESRAVFLRACGLPDRWRGRRQFTVAELGFGTGLNFLALWQMWQQERDGATWLHFVSFEGYPLDREDAARALKVWPELSELSQQLLANWPERAFGIHHVVWPEERLTLTLHIGQVEIALPDSDFEADAWFLDGFSPARNGEMWDDALWPLLAERSAPGAFAATFTVAGAVRRGLEAAGFQVAKQPGHGRKRERLEAVLDTDHAPVNLSKDRCQIAIIGAGIAGANVAHALRQRGAEVTVLDRATGPAEGTSGNPLALVMPRLDAGDTVEARLLVEAYLSACRTYRDLPGCETVDVTHLPKDSAEAERFQKVLSDPPLGLERLEALRGGGLLHKQAMLIRPSQLIPALLEGVAVHWADPVHLDVATRSVNGTIFDAIIVANGMDLAALCPWLRLTGRMGQVEHYRSPLAVSPSAIASGHYALASGHDRLWGATFEPVPAAGAATSMTARETNHEALQRLNPFWRVEADKASLNSRAGVRATTPDRLPVIGPLPDLAASIEALSNLRTGGATEASAVLHEGVHIAGGFGSRGFTWGPWAAAILATDILASPSAASRRARQAVAPERQIRRDLKRRLI